MYTLPDACALLDVHPATLRRWIARAQIELVRLDADLRFRYLKVEDVHLLAMEHQRVIATPEVAKLAAEVADLRRQVEEMKKAGHP